MSIFVLRFTANSDVGTPTNTNVTRHCQNMLTTAAGEYLKSEVDFSKMSNAWYPWIKYKLVGNEGIDQITPRRVEVQHHGLLCTNGGLTEKSQERLSALLQCFEKSGGGGDLVDYIVVEQFLCCQIESLYICTHHSNLHIQGLLLSVNSTLDAVLR